MLLYEEKDGSHDDPLRYLTSQKSWHALIIVSQMSGQETRQDPRNARHAMATSAMHHIKLLIGMACASSLV
jgi:hypothetical protein